MSDSLIGKIVQINGGRAVGRVIRKIDNAPGGYLVNAFQKMGIGK
jgi:hypothetical protein